MISDDVRLYRKLWNMIFSAMPPYFELFDMRLYATIDKTNEKPVRFHLELRFDYTFS